MADLLVIVSAAGFIDVSDNTLAAEEILTDDSVVKLLQNSKFSAIRSERIFMGYFKHGDTIAVPLSPVDGYKYSRDEVSYDATMYSTRAPGISFASGQATPPEISITQPANLYWFRQDVSDLTGVASIDVSYYKAGSEETITHDGIIKVYANCQRHSVNL